MAAYVFDVKSNRKLWFRLSQQQRIVILSEAKDLCTCLRRNAWVLRFAQDDVKFETGTLSP